MRWRRVLCVTSLGISFFSANAESQTGTVSGEAPDAVVHFNNKTDSSYSMHAQSSGGWVFTEDFSWGGPNGWYSDAKYSIACERIPLVETAFVDASLCFGASMNGSMYKPGGEGGSPIPWSVSSAFHTAPQPYIYPAESIFAKGEPQALRYIVDNVMTSAPGGFWKYNGVTVTGSSVQTDWQNIGSSYTLPSTLDAGLYTVNAARNSAGAFGASATVDIVGVKQLSATFGSTTITSTTDSPGENQTLYVPKVPSGSNITITATPEPGSAWPNNYPVWQGATGNGSTATFTPSSAGETIITATCGTSVKAIKIIVVDVSAQSIDASTPSNALIKYKMIPSSIQLTCSFRAGNGNPNTKSCSNEFTFNFDQAKLYNGDKLQLKLLSPDGNTLKTIDTSVSIEQIDKRTSGDFTTWFADLGARIIPYSCNSVAQKYSYNITATGKVLWLYANDNNNITNFAMTDLLGMKYDASTDSGMYSFISHKYSFESDWQSTSPANGAEVLLEPNWIAVVRKANTWKELNATSSIFRFQLAFKRPGEGAPSMGAPSSIILTIID